MRFDDNTFDIVVGNQTMKHWEENEVHLLKGLSEVFHVLKPGGQMFVNECSYSLSWKSPIRKRKFG